MKPRKQRFWNCVRRAVVVLALVAGVLGYIAWDNLFREEPQNIESMSERFKYGSIGTEASEGIPFWIWVLLPRIFPKHLPGGYTSLGLNWEEGHETPVGFSKKTIGFPRIGINCALCHAGSYRTSPESGRVVVAGAPATRINVLEYQRFLFNCASDPGFTADNIMPMIEYNTKLNPVEKMLYRHVLIPQTRTALLKARVVLN